MNIYPYDSGIVAPQYTPVYSKSKELPDNGNLSVDPSSDVGTVADMTPFTVASVSISYPPYTAFRQDHQPSIQVKKFSESGNKIDPSKAGIKGLTNEDAVQKLIDSGNRYLLSENYKRLSNLLGGVQ